jgi:hypothetical protein
MKFNKGQIFENGSSWLSLGMNVVSGILLSPFILHRLGDEAFGLWILIFSIAGGLFLLPSQCGRRELFRTIIQ